MAPTPGPAPGDQPVDTSAADASATESYLGYLYQGYFALTVLLDAADRESVSVETQDDVVLHGAAPGAQPTLHQLKHSRAPGRPLTVKNDGLWKTLGLWVADYRRSPGRYVFVTAAPLAPDSVLAPLAVPDSERGPVVAALVAEAERVRDARAGAGTPERHLSTAGGRRRSAPPDTPGKTPPYETRAAGTGAFLTLSPVERADLVRRIAIMPSAFHMGQVDEAIERRLRAFVLPTFRQSVGQRLRAWWDRRVTLALLKELPRRIDKNELLDCLQNLVAEERELTLPDDYSTVVAPPDVTADRESMLVRQIELVDGRASRIRRALEARWKAREQRRRWMDRDLSLAPLLRAFDERLIGEWEARFGPLCDDCETGPEAEKVRRGRELLDWSHLTAPREVEALRPEWRKDFYTQGAYQQLADELKVGWHPEYRARLDTDVARHENARAAAATAAPAPPDPGVDAPTMPPADAHDGASLTGAPVPADQQPAQRTSSQGGRATGRAAARRPSRRARSSDPAQVTLPLDHPTENVREDAVAATQTGGAAPNLGGGAR